MSLSKTAQDALRVATTAGLSKDVIDLLKEKIELLDHKLEEASEENLRLMRENIELRRTTEAQEKKLNFFEKGGAGLPEAQEKILKLLHQTEDLSVESLATEIGLTAPDTKYHIDELESGEYIKLHLNKSHRANQPPMAGGLNYSRRRSPQREKTLGIYYILPKGREYVVNQTG